MSSRDIAFCLAEDRLDCETGLRLAILSLSHHCPDTPIYAYRPVHNQEFAAWVRRFPQVTLFQNRPAGASDWNCKPQALKPLLEKMYRQVVWLDSDVLVTADCRRLFTNLDDRVLAMAQEPACQPNQGTDYRTRGWGFKVSRSLPYTLNSAVLCVSRKHLPLLDRWESLLSDPRYLASQKLPLDQRPLPMSGDQEILNALLGSDEFADIPLRVLGTGTEILHLGGELGYSSMERLRGLFHPIPVFLHAIAGKPWLWLSGDLPWSKPELFGWHRRLLQELSPYVFEARHYKSQLGTDPAWMYRRTALGTGFRLLSFGHFALRGFPLTLLADLLRRVKLLKSAQREHSATGKHEPMKRWARLLFWKLCFPGNIKVLPPEFNIISGPFRGMRYIDEAHCSLISPKILGTYEKELNFILKEVLETSFEKIVDVGAAEGYYAVGIAYARPDLATKIIAFEAEEAARNLLRKLAGRNRIDGLQVYGRCDPKDLAKALDGPGLKLVICDVEGFEVDLLNPRAVPGLLDAWVLVELHDCYRERTSESVRLAFNSTHSIQEIASLGRTWQDFPVKGIFARLLPRSLARRAMGEGRPPRMSWFWMKPLPR